MAFRVGLTDKFLFSSIRGKILFGVGVILFAVLGGFNYYDVITQVKRHTQDNSRLAADISDTVLASIEHPMLDGDMDKVEAILVRLGRLEDIVLVNLCDDQGVVKYDGVRRSPFRHTHSAVVLESLRTGKLAQAVESSREKKGEKTLRYAIPIHNDEPCFKCHGSEKKMLGVLSVGFSWSQFEKTISTERSRHILMAVMSLGVVGFFLTLWLNRFITRPLEQLTQITDDVSHGGHILHRQIPGTRKVPCWEALDCKKNKCPAYGRSEIPCWYMQQTLCRDHRQGESRFGFDLFPKGDEVHEDPPVDFREKMDECLKCSVYQQYRGDEILRLQDSFQHMLYKMDRYEEELRSSEEKHRLLFNANPNPIFIIDKAGFGILDVNERAMGQYGYSKEELLRMTFLDLGHRREGDVVKEFLSLSPGETGFISKKTHKRKDDRKLYVAITVSPFTLRGKEAWIVTTTDITESVETETQLVQASKMTTMGQMASGIAHELNQPLNVIKIASDFVLRMIKRGEKIEYDDLRTVSEEISGHVDRASGIINHLRDFSRASAPVKLELDINRPIMDVFKVLGQQLRLHQIEVKLELAENLPAILAEHNRLEQVFINLVTNALDAIDEKAKKKGPDCGEKSISISTFAAGGEVVAVVSDTGIGIPDGVREKIFEPFFTTKEPGKGTGLGMSISFGIVRDYGGTITVKSKEGVGTTFEIRFPVSAGSENKNVNVIAN